MAAIFHSHMFMLVPKSGCGELSMLKIGLTAKPPPHKPHAKVVQVLAMSDGPVHISDVMARAFSEVAGGRGRFRGLRLNEFTYPDFHAPEATLFDYRLPFEDCGKFALGDVV
ncbi:MAG: hypothetical protein LW710_08320, partial [Burkholderiales bacterium]|nr:hypothetical protein [Burkholderiales bacterium]